jgi:hypothetical protein
MGVSVTCLSEGGIGKKQVSFQVTILIDLLGTLKDPKA